MTRRELLSVALVATVVRLVAFTQHLASPLVEHPALDARYYDLAARSLVEGELAPGLGTGFRSLLYPRILAAVYTLAGDWGRLAALLLQHAAGVATALVVAALAFRVWGRRSAALAAGLLYALGAPPVFFEGELLVESWFVAVVAAQLLAFALVDDRREPGDARVALAWALLAGALAAVGVRLRPNHLLFVAALPLLLLPRAARSARRPAVLAALGGALATLVALALWELPSIGRFQLVPSAGGVNLYLGNKRAADGMIPRQDWGVTYAEEYRDSVEVFAEEAFRSDRGLAPGDAIDPGALSRYWLGRAASEIAADPWGRLALLGRKCLLLLWNVEIPNHRSFDFVAREEIPLLARLPVRFGLLFALALAGLAVRRGAGPPRPAGPRASDAALGPAALLLFTGVHAAGVVLFFVNDRYRLPLWPALAALAGGGASALVASARERRWRELAPPLGAACLGALLCFPNWTGTRLPGPGRDLLYRSIAWSDRGAWVPARSDAERAAALEPHQVAPWLQLGAVCAAEGDLARAAAAYERVLALHPEHTAALTARGELLERAGALPAAHRYYCRAVAAEPGFPPPLLAAAWLELRAGREAEAHRHLESLPARARSALRFRIARAELDRRLGGAGAVREIRLHPSEERAATALLAELDAPLAAGTISACAPIAPDDASPAR